MPNLRERLAYFLLPGECKHCQNEGVCCETPPFSNRSWSLCEDPKTGQKVKQPYSEGIIDCPVLTGKANQKQVIKRIKQNARIAVDNADNFF